MKQKIYTLYGLWMKRTILASSLIFTILFTANAQTQLVQWNFSNFSNTPTANLPQNAGKLVTAVGQSQAAFISAAGTLYDPPYIVNGWNQPGDVYFLLNFSTLGYMNNTISYYLGAFE